ncbi:MAG: WD40/YVTN/BNR-like repeat-containing protein, partial [Flavobacteriales bacterium]
MAAQQAYTATYTQNFVDRYNSTCMQALEELSLEMPDVEHHFTLYYYDQAGNLVRTVPPEGVERKAFTTYQAPEAQLIAQDRSNGTHTVYTEHRLASDHVYNSLEQPIRTAMPDQDNMDIRETGPTSGLPAAMRITGSWFGDGGSGMLTGVIDMGPLSRGVVYTTSNGGKTWSRSNGVVAADLLGADFFDDGIGMAVGAHGTVLRTLDGGQSWDLVYNELMAAGATLRDVVHADDDLIGAVGADGICLSSDGGDDFTIYGPTTATYTGIGYDGTDYTICGTGDLIGYEQGFITRISTAGSITGSIQQGTIKADLNCAAHYGVMKAYAGGDMGVLLHTDDGGANWQTITTGMTRDFKALYFADADFGVALVDSTYEGDMRRVLHKTIDGGRTWTPAGNHLTHFNDLKPILNSTTYTECMAVGDNGLVWRLILSGGTVGIIPIGGLVPLPGDVQPNVTAVWAGWDGDALRCVVGLSNGKLQYRANITTPSTWFSETPSSGSAITTITGAVLTGQQVHCTAIRADGTMRDAKWNFSIIPPVLTPNPTPPAGTFAGLAQVANDKAAVRHVGTGALHLIDLLTPTYSTSTPTAWSTPPTLTGHRVTAAMDDAEHIVLLGDQGAIHTAGTYWSGFEDQQDHVRPVPLNRIDKGAAVAVGHQGTLFLISGTTGTAVPTYHAQHLRGVHRLTTDDILVVGDAGTCLHVDASGSSPVITPVALPIGDDLVDVRAVEDELYITTANGQVLY